MDHSPLHGPTTALVVVDVQNDFADPAGALHVEGGETIVAGINVQIADARAAGGVVVMTQDWHPPSTPHFVGDGGPWPTHCVRGTWGAELHPGLSTDADLVLRKGTGGEDGYSAFGVADPRTGDTRPTGLAAFLGARGVETVVVVGLALDVCVKATAVDAAAEGFAVTVLPHLARAVELAPGDAERALTEMRAAGAGIGGPNGPGGTDTEQP